MRYWFILILLCIGAPLTAQDTNETEKYREIQVNPRISDVSSGDSIYVKAPLLDYNFVEPREYIIKNIDVKEINGKAVQKALVILYSGLSIGQTIKLPGQEIPKAIENIWKRNYFSDIQVYFLPTSNEGEIVVQFLVTEQPKLNGYRFLNISNSQAKSLKEECDLRQGMYITPNLINRTIQKIEAFYLDKGHFNVKVIVKRPIAKNKDGSLMVGFENFDFIIEKGPKVRVYDFVFNGNKDVPDKDLRKAISTIKRRKLKWNIFASSKYTEDKFKEGKAELITFYQKLGYRDARVVSDSITMYNDKRILVHLNLVEGNKYRFRSIKWKGNEKYRTSFLDTLLGIRKGDVFNQSLLDERLFSNPGGFDIQTLYMDAGYLFFNMMSVEVGVFNDSIDLEIRINEGPQAVIGRVSWSGNTKTSDRVILREVRTKPGNKFSRSDIQRTMRDLAAVGLFDPEQLNVNPKPNPADGTVDIEYKLVEKPSDQIELSGGWGGNGFSTTPTLIGTAGIVLNNFSSFEPGHYMKIRSTSSNYELVKCKYFELNFNIDNERALENCSENFIYQKLGWQLGFRGDKATIDCSGLTTGPFPSPVNPTASPDTASVISPGVCHIAYPRYLYIAIDDFQTSARNFFAVASPSTIAPNIVARINILSCLEDKTAFKNAGAPGDYLYTNKHVREYFGPTNIKKMRIQLLDEYGRLFPINNMDWSFVASFECFYN